MFVVFFFFESFIVTQFSVLTCLIFFFEMHIIFLLCSGPY